MKKFIVVREVPTECDSLETAEEYAETLIKDGLDDEVIVAEVVCILERSDMVHRRRPEGS